MSDPAARKQGRWFERRKTRWTGVRAPISSIARVTSELIIGRSGAFLISAPLLALAPSLLGQQWIKLGDIAMTAEDPEEAGLDGLTEKWR